MREAWVQMGKVIAVMTVLAAASTAVAFEGGGRKPSEAPLISIGQHYTGQLNNHNSDANYNGSREVAIWRLPPVTTHDVVTIDWHGVPYTRSGYSGFPICLILAQGVDDFSWGTVFGNTLTYCEEGGPVYSLSGSGSAHTSITVQETNPNSSYLEFTASANEDNPTSLETYPYDFTVEPILHYLALAAKPVQRVSAGGIFRATANLATGLPAPDGLPFTLAVTWPGGGIASYTAASAGGQVAFQLALPETAYGKTASFVVSHPADGTYQAAAAAKIDVKVARPKAPGPSLCEQAQQRAHVLARQHRRLQRNAARARGALRGRLRHRASQVGRRLRAARAAAASACAAT
jgi:hypothetical protein